MPALPSAGRKTVFKGGALHDPPLRNRTPQGSAWRQIDDAAEARISEHGTQLREKQKARHIYGVYERQFRRYLDKAARSRGVTGAMLMQMLERRLDNVVFRLGFGDSRSQARQTVKHGHIRVNGRRATIPSFQVSQGDVVTWKDQSKDTELFKTVSAGLERKNPPGWLKLNPRYCVR